MVPPLPSCSSPPQVHLAPPFADPSQMQLPQWEAHFEPKSKAEVKAKQQVRGRGTAGNTYAKQPPLNTHSQTHTHTHTHKNKNKHKHKEGSSLPLGFPPHPLFPLLQVEKAIDTFRRYMDISRENLLKDEMENGKFREDGKAKSKRPDLGVGFLFPFMPLLSLSCAPLSSLLIPLPLLPSLTPPPPPISHADLPFVILLRLTVSPWPAPAS